jgi:hypothetical protein
MNATDEPLDRQGDRDFAFYSTMDEVLLMAREHLELARHAPNDVLLGSYLRITARTMRCALEIYLDRLAANATELKGDGNVSGDTATQHK